MRKEFIWIFVILVIGLISLLIILGDRQESVGNSIKLNKIINDIKKNILIGNKNQNIAQNKIKNIDNFNSQISELEPKNSFNYKIKIIDKGNGNIETIYPELNQNGPLRDRPGRGDPVDDINRTYFYVNITLSENDEWVRDKMVYVILYHDDVIKDMIRYDFEENHRINIPENFLINDINDNFDVILFLDDYFSNESGYFSQGIMMVKPLLENNSRIIFNLSNARIIRTNVDELNEEKGTNTIFFDWGILKNNEGILGVLLLPLHANRERPRNFVVRGYIAGNTINNGWNFLISYFLSPVSYEENREINHLALTKRNITSPFERIYEFNEENLNHINFNIKDSFHMDSTCLSPDYGIIYSDSDKWFYCFDSEEIPKETLPREANLLFSENNYFSWVVTMYNYKNMSENGFYNLAFNTLYQKIYFEDYYNEHMGNENITLNIIEKPDALKLLVDNSQTIYPLSYLIGYLHTNNNISIHENIPNGYIFTNKIQNGRVTITNPNNRVYSSQSNGSNFFIMCYNRGVIQDNSHLFSIYNIGFREMECVDGNYTIRWAFTNIIKDEDLYLNAIVHYDGENWSITNQNSRLVNYNICGNSIKGSNEACDRNDWGNITSCRDLGFGAGNLSCIRPTDLRRNPRQQSCTFDVSGCYYVGQE